MASTMAQPTPQDPLPFPPDERAQIVRETGEQLEAPTPQTTEQNPEQILTTTTRVADRDALDAQPVSTEPTSLVSDTVVTTTSASDSPLSPDTQQPSVVGAELPPGQSVTEPVKDADLWMEDGNLILVTPKVQFRVYRGPLVAQSLVFRDMLSLPQPVDPNASVNNCAYCIPCATIPVTDPPEDLRYFLRVFTGQNVCFGNVHPTFNEISALVRLGHKYQCEKLLEWCTKYLSRYYHDDFELWRSDEAVFSPPNFERIHNIGVVNMARLIGADKMLPGALMGCCMLDRTELIEGFTREDGFKETLSLEDIGRCYMGRANLVEANAEATLKLMQQTVAEDCRRPERCQQTLRKILNELTKNNRKVLFNLRWDWSWTPFIDREDDEREFCWECYKMLGKHGRQKERHRDIYDRLPQMMGVEVPGWGAPPPEPASTDDTTHAAEAQGQDAPAPAAAADP